MTELEAIKRLEYIKHVGNGEQEYKHCAEEIALDMAIKAIEKQISLERILERLKKEKRDFNYENIDNWNMSRKEKEMYEDGVNKAIEIVKEEGGIE